MTGWTAATIAGLALPQPLAASLGVAALLAVPGGETLTNPTNVQWIMAPALPLIAAAASPAGRLARANQLAFVALSGLSGPFSILMIPIWLWRVLSGARRDAFALVLAATTSSPERRRPSFWSGRPKPSTRHRTCCGPCG